MFGGSGMYMDRFVTRGQPVGLLVLHGYGNVFERRLAPGESVLLEPGAFLYKDASVTLEVERQRLTGRAVRRDRPLHGQGDRGRAGSASNRCTTTTGPGKEQSRPVSARGWRSRRLPRNRLVAPPTQGPTCGRPGPTRPAAVRHAKVPMPDAHQYTCPWCGLSTADVARTTCPACGSPLDVRAAVSPGRGWTELPPIRDMAKLQFGQSFCQIEGAVRARGRLQAGRRRRDLLRRTTCCCGRTRHLQLTRMPPWPAGRGAGGWRGCRW